MPSTRSGRSAPPPRWRSTPSACQHRAVFDDAWPGDLHVPAHDDTGAEAHVADDLEALALGQRRRAGGEVGPEVAAGLEGLRIGREDRHGPGGEVPPRLRGWP